MPTLTITLRRLARCTRGASALEYAIIASLVSVAAIGAFMLLGGKSNEQLHAVGDAYEHAR